MRENAVKRSLAAGGKAFGSMVFEFFTPGMPRIVKNAGAEFACTAWSIPAPGSKP